MTLEPTTPAVYVWNCVMKIEYRYCIWSLTARDRGSALDR